LVKKASDLITLGVDLVIDTKDLVKETCGLVTLDVDLVNQTPNKNYSIKNGMQSNLNTYFVNDRTMCYYAHDIVIAGSKYLVSMVNSYRTHHQQSLFNKLSFREHSVVSIRDCIATFLLLNSNIINNWETDIVQL
jgi:hypothetical protein